MNATVIYVEGNRRGGFNVKAKTEKEILEKIRAFFKTAKLDPDKCNALYRITKK